MTAAIQEPACRPDSPPRRRRWRRRLCIAVVAIALVAIFHATLLRWLAFGLVVDGYDGPSDAAVIVGGYGPFAGIPTEEAARQYQGKLVPRVLVIENRSARTVRLGIVPTLETVVRRELNQGGVPADAIVILPVDSPGPHEAERLLQRWLDDHATLTVTILCDELSSRRTAAEFRRALTSEALQRVRFQPLPDQRFGPDTWWRSRQGIMALLSEYISLTYTLVVGDDEPSTPWDPDQFEQSLIAR